MKHLFLSSIGLATLLCSGQAHAQLVSCNVFLQGKYVEAGINNNGAFGTSVAAPAGYHANVNDTMYNPCTLSYSVPLGLGFVADPMQDGWSVGTPPMYGDYIYPVTPNEGWMIEDNSGTGKAYASYLHTSGATGYSGPLNGVNTSYGTIGSVRSGVWAGALTTDTLAVQQTTTLDTNNLYLLMHIRFLNGGHSAIDSFFYLRSVNPHSDETISSRMYTLNKIENQLPNPANMVLVSAQGTSDTSAYMALATKDYRARGFIIKHSALPYSGSLASVYWGDTAHYMYQQSDTLTENGGMGLVFRLGMLGPGDSLVIDFGYSFRGGVIDTALDTVPMPLHSVDRTVERNIAVYPNPSKDFINITGLNEGDRLSVYDLIGGSMLGQTINNATAIMSFHIANLPPGVYLLTVTNAEGNIVKRVSLRKN